MVKPILILALLPLATCISFAQTKPAQSPDEIKRLLKTTRSDTGRLRLLQDLVLALVLKPGEEATDLNEAFSTVTQALQLSQSLREEVWEGRCLILFSMIFREKGEKQTGKTYAQKAIDFLKKCEDKEALGDAYLELGSYYDPFSGNEIAERVRLQELAEQMFAQAKVPRRQADALKTLGDLYQVQGELTKSMEVLRKALGIYQSIQHPDLQGVYDLMGTVSQQTGNYQQALQYALLAVQTAEAVQDTTQQFCTILNRLGVIYYQLGQNAQARDCFQKSIAVAKRYKDTAAVRVLTPNIVNTLLRLNKPADALEFLKDIEKTYPSKNINDRVTLASSFLYSHLTMSQPDKARPYFQQLLKMYDEVTSPGMQKTLNRSVLRYLFATGQYNLAYKYLPVYEELNKKHVSLTGLADTYHWWFRADSALGNYPDAIRHLQMMQTMKDSMANIASKKQIAQLEIQFETDKKERSIQLLMEQGRTQASELQKANLMQNVTFGGAGLLLVIIGLLYNRNRLKQKSARELEAQQKEINEKNTSLQRLLEEKEWLLKEIHHRVKNNLQIAISLLNTQIAYLDNDAATEAIRESQHRMYAMSLIHQKLYQSDKLTLINMASYIRELLDYLDDNFNASRHIRFDLQVASPVELEVTQAVPVGLILNEAITNAIKYAFPNGEKGNVAIFMDYSGENRLLLSVRDNGVGLPARFEASENDSFGISLMRGLARQLNGTFHLESIGGVAVTIEFPDEKMANRNAQFSENFKLSES